MKQEPLNRNNLPNQSGLTPATTKYASLLRQLRDEKRVEKHRAATTRPATKSNKDFWFGTSYGMSLVEFIIATALVGFVAISLVQVGEIALRASRFAGNRVTATFLLQEGVEATSLLRDKSWNQNIAPRTTDVDYFLSFSGSEYSLSETPAPLIENTFERTIRFSDVGRNAQSDITPGGTTDEDAKKITVSVSWFERGATTTEQMELYLTNLFKN